MGKIYKLNGKNFTEEQVVSAAQKSGMPVQEYIAAAGFQVSDGSDGKAAVYIIKDKQFTEDQIANAAQKSGMSVEEYLSVSQAKKKDGIMPSGQSGSASATNEEDINERMRRESEEAIAKQRQPDVKKEPVYSSVRPGSVQQLAGMTPVGRMSQEINQVADQARKAGRVTDADVAEAKRRMDTEEGIESAIVFPISKKMVNADAPTVSKLVNAKLQYEAVASQLSQYLKAVGVDPSFLTTAMSNPNGRKDLSKKVGEYFDKMILDSQQMKYRKGSAMVDDSYEVVDTEETKRLRKLKSDVFDKVIHPLMRQAVVDENPNATPEVIGKKILEIEDPKGYDALKVSPNLIRENYDAKKKGLEAKLTALGAKAEMGDASVYEQGRVLAKQYDNVDYEFPQIRKNTLRQLVNERIAPKLKEGSDLVSLTSIEAIREIKRLIQNPPDPRDVPLLKQMLDDLDGPGAEAIKNMSAEELSEAREKFSEEAKMYRGFGILDRVLDGVNTYNDETIKSVKNLFASDKKILEEKDKESLSTKGYVSSEFAVIQPDYVVDSNEKSPTYGQMIENPNKGKFQWKNVLGAGVEGVAQLGYQLVLGELTGGLISPAISRIAAIEKGIARAEQITKFGTVINKIESPFAKATAMNAKLFIPAYLMSYDQNYKQSFDIFGAGDEAAWKRTAYSQATSILEGLTEKIGNVYEQLNFTNEIAAALRKNVADNIKNLTVKQIKSLSKAELKDVFTKIGKTSLGAVYGTLDKQGNEILEELANTLGENMTVSLLEPEEAEKRDLYGDLKRTAQETFASMAFLGLGGAIGGGVRGYSNSSLSKQAMFDIATRSGEYKDGIEKMFAAGALTQQERDEKLRMVNTIEKAKENWDVAKTAVLGREIADVLSQGSGAGSTIDYAKVQKKGQQYVQARANELILEKELKRDDLGEAAKSSMQKMVTKWQNVQRAILENDVDFDEAGNPSLKPVVPAGMAEVQQRNEDGTKTFSYVNVDPKTGKAVPIELSVEGQTDFRAQDVNKPEDFSWESKTADDGTVVHSTGKPNENPMAIVHEMPNGKIIAFANSSPIKDDQGNSVQYGSVEEARSAALDLALQNLSGQGPMAQPQATSQPASQPQAPAGPRLAGRFGPKEPPAAPPAAAGSAVAPVSEEQAKAQQFSQEEVSLAQKLADLAAWRDEQNTAIRELYANSSDPDAWVDAYEQAQKEYASRVAQVKAEAAGLAVMMPDAQTNAGMPMIGVQAPEETADDSFRGIRDDDFVRKYMSPQEQQAWQEASVPDRKQMILDKKAALKEAASAVAVTLPAAETKPQVEPAPVEPAGEKVTVSKRVDPNSKTLLLDITSEFSESDTEDFDKKDEHHITVISFPVGRMIKEASPEVQAEVDKLIEETDFEASLTPELFKVKKSYKTGERESIVRAAVVPQMKEFYEKLGKILGKDLGEPFPHVTVATKGDRMGIGIPSKKDFEALSPVRVEPKKKVDEGETTAAADKPVQQAAKQFKPKAEKGATEKAPASPAPARQPDAARPAAVRRAPADGDRVTVVSRTDKKGIEYFFRDGSWRFVDSRQKEQKATAKENAMVTEAWEEAQGFNLDQEGQVTEAEPSMNRAGMRQQIKDGLVKLRDKGLLMTADKSLIAKVKRAMGVDVAKVRMTDKEIEANMALLDAMADTWKAITGIDNFYEEFFAGIKEGDLEELEKMGGTLFQKEGDKGMLTPVRRVTLSVFTLPQMKQFEGKMVNPQQIRDLLKSKGKEIEKAIIESTLSMDKYKDQKKISFDDFRFDTELQILKLEKLRSTTHQSYGAANVGLDRSDISHQTIIFNTAINHGYPGHFDGDYTASAVASVDYEVRQLNENTWAAIQQGIPEGTTQDELINYIGTAGSREEVESWVSQRKNGTRYDPLNVGYFAHARFWFDVANSVMHIAELQSDWFQRIASFKRKFGSAKNFFEAKAVELAVDKVKEYRRKVRELSYAKGVAVLLDRFQISYIEKDIPGNNNGRMRRDYFDSDGNLIYSNKYMPTSEFYNQEFYDSLYDYLKDHSRDTYDTEYVSGTYVIKEDGSEYSVPDKIIYRFYKQTYNPDTELVEYVEFEKVEVDESSDDDRQLRRRVRNMRQANQDLRDELYEVDDVVKANEKFSEKEIEKINKSFVPEAKALYTSRSSLPYQLDASEKVWFKRLLQESVRHAIESGATKIRLPYPLTLAIAESWTSKYSLPDVSDKRNMPYEISVGDADGKLIHGDTIVYNNERYKVVRTSDDKFMAVFMDHLVYDSLSTLASRKAQNLFSEALTDLRNSVADGVAKRWFTKPQIEAWQPTDWAYSILKEELMNQVQKDEEEYSKLEDYEKNPDYVPEIWVFQVDQAVVDRILNEVELWSVDELADKDNYSIDANTGRVYLWANNSRVVELSQPDTYPIAPNAKEDEMYENFIQYIREKDPNNPQDVDLRAPAKNYASYLKSDVLPKYKPRTVKVEGWRWYEFDVTPEMVSDPIVAFQKQGEKVKAAVDFTDEGRAMVHIFQGADISSLAHEMSGHVGRRMLERLAAKNDVFAEKYEALKIWAGVVDDKWTTAAEEKFARALEKYLREGKAPNKNLKSVFESIREWLKNIYKVIKGSDIDVELTDEVRSIFDAMFSGTAPRGKVYMKKGDTVLLSGARGKIVEAKWNGNEWTIKQDDNFVRASASIQKQAQFKFDEEGPSSLSQLAPELEQTVFDIKSEYPDVTTEEIVEQIQNDAPDMVDTLEKLNDVRRRIDDVLNPRQTKAQKQSFLGKVVANGKKALAGIFENMFGADQEQSSAAAEIADLIIGNMARLNGISKEEQYKRIAYQESSGKVFSSALYQNEDEDQQYERRQRVREGAKRWLREYIDFLGGKYKGPMHFGPPSSTLIAAGIPDFEIRMHTDTLNEKFIKHGWGNLDLYELPDALQEPIAVLRSENNSNRVVVLTRLKKDGHNAIVIVDKAYKNDSKSYNEINSVYPKNNIGAVLGWIEKGLLDYADTKPLLEWIDAQKENINPNLYPLLRRAKDRVIELSSAKRSMQKQGQPSGNTPVNLKKNVKYPIAQVLNAASQGRIRWTGSREALQFAMELAKHPFIKDSTVKFVDQIEGHPWAFGVAYGASNRIELTGMNVAHMAHEMMHLLTVGIIDAKESMLTPKERRFKRDLLNVYDKYYDYLSNIYMEYSQREMVDELVADAFIYGSDINKSLRSDRYTVTYNERIRKSLLREMWDAIRRFFGLKTVDTRKVTREVPIADYLRESFKRAIDEATPDRIYRLNRLALARFNPTINAAAAEKARIKEQAIKDGTFMLAPDGTETRLSEDQWLMVRTKAFKQWFGDWEKISVKIYGEDVSSAFRKTGIPFEYIVAVLGQDVPSWIENKESAKLNTKQLISYMFNREIEQLKGKENPGASTLNRIKALEKIDNAVKNDLLTVEDIQQTGAKDVSRVIGHNGEPMVVYHGTNLAFTEFNPYSFFSPDPDYARIFGQNIVPVFLSIKNPIDLYKYELANEEAWKSFVVHSDLIEYEYGMQREALISSGAFDLEKLFRQEWGNKDGVVGREAYSNEQQSYVITDPSQVKHATDNTGDFSSEDARILYQDPSELPSSVEVVNGFYSPIEKKILEYKQPSASVQKWRTIIGKSDEAVWTGVSRFLESLPPTETLTKAQIFDWMRNNRIKINVIEQGGRLEKLEQKRTEAIEKRDSLVKQYADLNELKINENDPDKRAKIANEMDSLYDQISQYYTEIDRLESNIRSGHSGAEYQAYSVPGEMESYREILVTIPNPLKLEWKRDKDNDKWVAGDYEISYDSGMDLYRIYRNGVYNGYAHSIDEAMDSVQKLYKAPHFPLYGNNTNIAVHLRVNTRKMPDGERVLFLEEVQSDWAQKGREDGFKISVSEYKKRFPVISAELKDKYGIVAAEGGVGHLHFEKFVDGKWEIVDPGDDVNVPDQEAKQLMREALDIKSKAFSNYDLIEPGPFVTETKHWVKLGLRVALREAVARGVSKIAWATGEQQYAKYWAMAMASEISYDADKKILYAYDEYGNEIRKEEEVKPERIEGYVGKSIANKILGQLKEEKTNESEVEYEVEKGEFSWSVREVGGDYLRSVTGDVRKWYSEAGARLAIQERKERAKRANVIGVMMPIYNPGLIGFYGSPTLGKTGIVGDVAKSIFGQPVKTISFLKSEGQVEVVKVNDDLYSINQGSDVLATVRRRKNEPDTFDVEYPDGTDFIAYSVEDAMVAVTSYMSSRMADQPYVDVTDEMRQQVMDGLPLYQDQRLSAQGAVVIGNAGMIIHAMTNPNVTTPLHELSHGYFDALLNAALSGNEQAFLDVRQVLNEVGMPYVSLTEVKGSSAIYGKVQEFFARGFEKYLRDGQAPRPELQSLFDRFASWLRQIYRTLVGSPVNIQLSDAMRDIYGRMLGEDVVEKDFPNVAPVNYTQNQVNLFSDLAQIQESVNDPLLRSEAVEKLKSKYGKKNVEMAEVISRHFDKIISQLEGNNLVKKECK